MSAACAVCADTGWVFVDGHRLPLDSRHFHTRGGVVSCLCLAGARVKSGPFRPTSLDMVWTAVEVEAAFPAGTAVAAQQAQRDRLQACGLARRHLDWTLESYRAEVAKDDRQLARYVLYAGTWATTPADGRSDVVLFGKPGTGKTGLAVAMLRGAFERGDSCKFVIVRDLLERVREGFGDNATESAREALAPYAEVEVLVLDEWGGTTLTDFARDTLTSLVDRRQSAQRATIITVNVADALLNGSASDQLSAVFGPRLLDRLSERAQLWGLDGQSRRRRKPLAPKP